MTLLAKKPVSVERVAWRWLVDLACGSVGSERSKPQSMIDFEDPAAPDRLRRALVGITTERVRGGA